MVTDLTPDNKLHRLFEKFSNESKIVTVSSIAMIVAILALLMSWISLSDAKHAKVKVDYELAGTRQEMLILKNQLRLTDVYLQENHILLEQITDPVPLPER
jgi:hypothetical protein